MAKMYRQKQANSTVGTPSSAVQRALDLLEQHPGYKGPMKMVSGSRANTFTVEFHLAVNMPFAWAAKGASPNGVRIEEPIRLVFPADFPFHAPLIELRADFNRALAHVMPGTLEELPVPCIYDGPLSELMQREGIAGILNQLVIWLEDAAMDRLIDPEQGWEPVRRDSLLDTLVASGTAIRDLVTKKSGHVLLSLDYLRADLVTDETKRYSYHGEVGEKVSNNPPSVQDRFSSGPVDAGIVGGTSIALLVWPPESRHGVLVVADKYLPETVTDLAGLQERAAGYGCLPELESALRWLDMCLEGKIWRGTLPIAVIVCARRPFHLIHQTSNIELCPYILEVTPGTKILANRTAAVRPAGHQEAIATPLLRRMSALGEPDTTAWPWVQVGCGSLGSKIALHLAREGRAPSAVIDNARFRVHNAARHALVPSGGSLLWLNSKARGLAGAVRSLGQDAKAHVADAARIFRDADSARVVLPKSAHALVNSTASLAVREALASTSEQIALPRVIETSLFAGGRAAFLSIEGNRRNPDTGDLITRFYEIAREDAGLRDLIYTEAGSLQRRMTGDGCGTMTMVMSDARLSLSAAAMAQSISLMQRTGFPENGRIAVGLLAEDGGFGWLNEDLTPCLRIATDNAFDYRVHLLPRAHEKIIAETAAWTGVETGGVLLGRFSEATQTFYIADVLPALEDSIRSAPLFVLGTQGLRNQLRVYGESSNHSLYCLGTWHSHLGEFGASGMDRHTADAIAFGRTLPSVLLIRTPTSYRAILARTTK